MKKFNVYTTPYDDRLYFRNAIEFKENTVSCIVGCNGTGKTTLMNMMCDQLKKENAVDFSGHGSTNNMFRGLFSLNEKEKKPTNVYYAYFDKAYDDSVDYETHIKLHARDAYSSTGEGIMNKYSDILCRVYNLLHKQLASKPKSTMFLFLDDCDAGTSIDNIIDIKKVFELIIKDCEKYKITYYIITSANSYEMARYCDCISVHNFKHLQFNDYEEYKKFVLDSRKRKEKRFKKNEE